MTRDRSITIKMPEALLAAAFRLSREDDLTPGEFIRAAVAARVAELGDTGYRDPAGVLRRALRRDFAEAADWLDLQRRLRAEKFVLRAGADDLWLYTWPLERRLLPLKRLGFDRDELTLVYGAPFPAFGPEPAQEARSGRQAA